MSFISSSLFQKEGMINRKRPPVPQTLEEGTEQKKRPARLAGRHREQTDFYAIAAAERPAVFAEAGGSGVASPAAASCISGVGTPTRTSVTSTIAYQSRQSCPICLGVTSSS